MAKRKQRLRVFQCIATHGLLAAACLGLLCEAEGAREHEGDFLRLPYNNPGLVVDLGVGLWAWPLPMDYDGDGDNDLLVTCPDVPFSGTYFFENSTGDKFPIFEPPVRVGDAHRNIQVSYVNGQCRLLATNRELMADAKRGLLQRGKLPLDENIHANKVRANQWKYVDYDADGALDLIIGVGDWTDYGWDNAFDSNGTWTRGPLHGYVYLVKNTGTDEQPAYATPVKLEAEGEAIDTYGMPTPNMADFDGDGDLDLLCGEFVDRFTYFENVGSREAPHFAAGQFLVQNGELLRVPLCMSVPVAIDWDKDGDVDLVVGQEDGRVMLLEHSGEVIDGLPRFLPARFFQQQAECVKFGALVTPFSYDWDGDGDEDLICGNTAGHIGWIENLDGGDPPRWAAPVLLRADGELIHIQAGPSGSIQGPCEAKWGYTTLSVADWDGDELADIVVNSIWGKVWWYRNVGTRNAPALAAGRPVEVDWQGAAPKPSWNWWDPEGGELVTQWRTTPVAYDWNGDGLMDLVMLDHEGYLVLFERERRADVLVLNRPRRIFADEQGKPLRLNDGIAGKSGRRKLCIADWDRDGQLDLLVNSENVTLLRGLGAVDGRYRFRDESLVGKRRLAGHTTSPTVVDWDKNGVPDLLVGAEDGFLYLLRNPRRSQKLPKRSGAVVESSFIDEGAPYASCHASTIAQTPSGLVASWFGGTAEGDPDVGIWFSRRTGNAWSTPIEVANGVQDETTRYPCWNPVLFQVPGGELLLFYKCGPSPSSWWGMLQRSSDGGSSWSEAERLPEGILGPIKNKPVLLGENLLYCGSSLETASGEWHVHFELTRDWGRSWQRIGPVSDKEGFHAIQPSVLTHADGRLQMLCRSKERSILTSWSEDHGRTWTPLERTSLPNPNSGTDAVTLDDGRQLLVYNHTPSAPGEPIGRSFLNVAISENGFEWSAAAVLENQHGAEFSYPAVIQTSDGMIHITYTWKRRRIRHVVLDPRRLSPQPIRDGKWPAEITIASDR